MSSTGDSMESEVVTAKIVLLGEASVGKSSLVLRFVQDKFYERTEGTIGAAFLTKQMDLSSVAATAASSATSQPTAGASPSNHVVKFEIWDTAGQERYHSLAPMYYRGAQAAIIVFDITSNESFAKAQYWVGELRKGEQRGAQLIMLVGNKLDIADRREVDERVAMRYAQEHQLRYIETSAKHNTNVLELFVQIAENVPRVSTRRRPGVQRLSQQRPAPERSGCPC